MVDKKQKIIKVHMFFHYKAAPGVKFEKGKLEALAKRHKKVAETLFNRRVIFFGHEFSDPYKYENKNKHQLEVTSEVEVYGANRGRPVLLGTQEVKSKFNFKGYTIEADIHISTDEKVPEGIYDEVEIHRGEIPENAGNLSTDSKPETVFHEFLHANNLLDEYERKDGKYRNWLEVFRKKYKRDPEKDAVMTCKGATMYGRYFDAILHDKCNLGLNPLTGWYGPMADHTHFLDEKFNDGYFGKGDFLFRHATRSEVRAELEKYSDEQSK